MIKKQKVVFAVVAAVLVLGIILSYIFGARNQHRDGVPRRIRLKSPIPSRRPRQRM